jgi:hypothetical protein
MRKTSTRKAKGKKNRPKIKLGIPDLEHSKAAVLEASVLRIQGADTSMLLTSSLPGIVLSRDWHSTKQWFCAIGFTWRSAASRLEPSTSDWQLCVGWLTRPRAQFTDTFDAMDSGSQFGAQQTSVGCPIGIHTRVAED